MNAAPTVSENKHLKSSLSKEQFCDLISAEYDTLYKKAIYFTRHKQDAEDLVQNTFLRALKHRHRYTHNKNMKGWLSLILFNLFVNDYRKKKRQPSRVNLDAIAFALAAKNKFSWHRERSINESIDTFFLFHDETKNALTTIPQSYRQVLLLVDVANASYKEAAEFLNCPVGTVMSRLHRARVQLARKLDQSRI
jgi:RNA polymerase sigma-70 factor (ECF subfamily)